MISSFFISCKKNFKYGRHEANKCVYPIAFALNALIR